MALKIIKPPTSYALIVWLGTAVLALVFGLVCARSFFINTLATRLDIEDPAAGPLVDGLAEAAPSDPDVHVMAAVYYERTFDVADLDRSLAEYKKAAESDPSNYTLWLAVARAEDRIGEPADAEAAFKRSKDLAPNYANIQWAYGNFLVRQGRGDEGFPLIAKAVAGNTEFSGPAVSLVIQMTGGNVAATRSLLGDTPEVNSALTTTFSSQKKYNDAVSAWSAISADLRKAKYKEVGQALLNALLADHEFRLAANVAGDLAADDTTRPKIGQITDGGFENGVKLRNAGAFEWQISDGANPQIGLNETQKHGGRYALADVFSIQEGNRSISQQIAVEPGARYRFDVWYRSNLKTEAKFRWQLVDIATGKALSATADMAPAEAWTALSTEVAVPPESDGIRLELVRTGCTSSVCATSGTIMFDDLSLTKQ